MKTNLAQLLALIAGLAGAAPASDDCRSWTDEPFDVLIRRTDLGADGPLHAQGTLPDLREVRLCGWQPDNPEPDCYSGQTVDTEDAHIFRLDVVFAGLVNPPGPVGVGSDFAPFLYGNSPVLGFLEFKVADPSEEDDGENTGGELYDYAKVRFLANAARFGRLPHRLTERAARSGDDLDGIFDTEPQYERSGADFSLVMCGCFTPEVVQLSGDGDGMFDPGESWLVFGRFFERAQGYQEASAAYNGSEPGLYDPIVQLRFKHDTTLNETTITLVWALDHEGAAFLKDVPVEVLDADVSNLTSMEEALTDIIAGAGTPGMSKPARTLVEGWIEKEALNYLDMKEWDEITCLFGAPYTQPESTFYVWTDTWSKDEEHGDLDGDGDVDDQDEALVRDAVYANDGGSRDADGPDNGVWVLKNPGWNFSVYDVDGNMRVDLYDQALYGSLADFNGDGRVDSVDVIVFLNAWAAGLLSADFNLDQVVNTQDFIAFLNAWVDG